LSTTHLYAHDALTYRKITDDTDACALQNALNDLQEREKTWLMQFNPEKCEVQQITQKQKPPVVGTANQKVSFDNR